jgi:hypothetical protein
MKKFFLFLISRLERKEYEDYAKRHKGLQEGQIYIGSDGHHHHYHKDRTYEDESENEKKSNYHSHRRYKTLEKELYYLLVLIAIFVVCFAIYAYYVE